MSRPRLSCKFLAIVSLLLCSVLNGSAAQSENRPDSLQPGKLIQREIANGEAHSYTLNLAAGQYAYVVVNQKGVDVVVTVYGPDGATITEMDGPTHNHGPEPVYLLADSAGTYRVEVKSETRRTGTYEIKLEQLRVATVEDRSRVAAQKLFAEAMELRDKRTEQSYQQAIEKHLSALTIWHNVNDKLMEGRSLLELGEIYGDTGQYQRAFDSYSQARALFKAIGSLTAEANVMSNTAWIYGQLEDNQKALETYDQVAEIYRAVGDIDAITMSNIGSSYAALGEYKRALDIHLQVLEMRRATNERARQAITLSNIGNCYYNLNDKRKALDYYQQALVLMPELKDDFYTATTLNDIGVIYRELGEYAQALDYLNRSLTLRRTVGDVRGVAFSLTHLARLERDRGNLIAARKFIEEALERAESLRYKIGSSRLRASYFASVHRSRDIYIDVLMRLHKQNPAEGLDRAAFNASETARARTLLEQLTEASKEIRHGVEPALLESERSVGESIAKKAANQIKLLSGKHTEEEANAVAKELATLTADYEQIQARIRESSPQYAALVQPAPLKIDEIQQRVLDADTLLLQYSLGQETSYLWAVTPESIKTYELPKRSIIEPLARRAYELLTARNVNVPKETLEQRRQRLELAEAEYSKAAANLSQTLLGPVASELKNKRLMIVSDGVLQYIPFAGLPDPQDSRPLMVQHEIVTAPSSSVVALLRQETANRKAATKTLAVLADPVFSSDDPRVSGSKSTETSVAAHAVRSANELDLGDLRRLRFSRQEAEEILRFAVDKDKLQAVDFAANRTLATSPDIGQYRIVHFATHGLINNKHPELSGVVLSLVDQKGQQQNGFLRLYDLYNLKLSADLVVLSACQTALGKEIQGEGLVGLTRGFMYAGAPRVVASLWQIDDRASAEFMKRFYQGLLGENLRPATALRAAQVSMQNDKRWNAPHYWAAFTLQGEWK